ncbi:AAA family ATPase [Mordavella massiliensis]|uniref:Nuclease SbcCD subunit C n=1 Tax=Mordavella massiliensis TaxID=1871024 RepID=A0A938XAS1_9CLOT|nr:SMC family ATPase [Mordavella massiliensis]MBM6948093.1 SMC family ATPase [Mordavella massiliensis]
MRPRRLTMQAFGSYGRKTQIDFDRTNQNLFLVTGDTGAGKTTIFDAIVFALYGEAGSSVNRKDGTELQSQFAEAGAEPFVELVFTDGQEEEGGVYTVRRSPRHVRPLKRGKGFREESGKVSLILPDGTEYPPKETDRKLEEIVGLTKAQFMQVAMIAQGEFMELLRAKSDDKKNIFRKLFHTELYEKIVEELGRRRREKQQDMARIRTVCQNEVSHAQAPADYEAAGELEELKEQILRSDRLSVSDMEAFLGALSGLLAVLEEAEEKAAKAYAEAEARYLARRDACTGAQQLAALFGQMEKAGEEAAALDAREKEMREALDLSGRIRSAWEIRSVFRQYEEAKERRRQTAEALQVQEAALPGLEQASREAKKTQETARESADACVREHAKISERTARALALFTRIETARKQVKEAETSAREASAAARTAKEKLAEEEEAGRELGRQIRRLASADARLEAWKAAKDKADALEKEMAQARRLEQELEKQEERLRDLQQAYGAQSAAYEQSFAEYEGARRIFLNLQAGWIAREQLRPGEPCPVCGSTDHPAPCRIEEEHREITRDYLDQLEDRTRELRDRQEQSALQAREAGALAAQQKERLQAMADSIWMNVSGQEEDSPSAEEWTVKEKLARGGEKLQDHLAALAREGDCAQRDVRTLRQLEKELEETDRRKETRRKEAEEAAKRESEAAEKLAAGRAALESMDTSGAYESAEEAKECLALAEARRKEAEEAAAGAQEEAEKAGTALQQALTRAEQYRQQLPDLERESALRRQEYEALLEEKQAEETAWRELTERYGRQEADRLQEQVHTWETRKAAAASRYHAAKEAVGERERPDPEKAKQEQDAAREEMERRNAALQAVSACKSSNEAVRRALEPVLAERGKVMEEYRKLDGLYSLLAGNVSGSRMDLETFVQRYYLEQILQAANRRFRVMSGGQFELCMCDLDRAGKGRNRGLDLMVWSAVTGKKREVRTLSGGESFMAALSLALGMADQIQAGASAVHLDIMFIDEGFGSLDEHARDKAVRVLQDMAEGSKLIGIISHVTELKQEIEDQLIVTRDEEGSHVRWQIS